MSGNLGTSKSASQDGPALVKVEDSSPITRGRTQSRDGADVAPVRCINPASDINGRLDTQVEVRVYPCNNSQGAGKKKFTTFAIKPEVSRFKVKRYTGSAQGSIHLSQLTRC